MSKSGHRVTTGRNEVDEKKLDPISRYLAGPHNRFVYKFRWLIIAVFIPVGAIAFWFALQIEPMTEEE